MKTLRKIFDNMHCKYQGKDDTGTVISEPDKLWRWITKHFVPKNSNRLEPQVKPFTTEIELAHVKDGIKDYKKADYEKCKEQLIKIIAILYHSGIDIKRRDIITVNLDDFYCFRVKERTLDLGETLRITYWIDDV